MQSFASCNAPAIAPATFRLLPAPPVVRAQPLPPPSLLPLSSTLPVGCSSRAWRGVAGILAPAASKRRSSGRAAASIANVPSLLAAPDTLASARSPLVSAPAIPSGSTPAGLVGAPATASVSAPTPRHESNARAGHAPPRSDPNAAGNAAACAAAHVRTVAADGAPTRSSNGPTRAPSASSSCQALRGIVRQKKSSGDFGLNE